MTGRVLITGGAGFIGSHLVECLQDHADVVVLDNLRTGCRRNLEGVRHTFIEGSVTDPAVVALAMQGVRRVFHLAALVSVPESIQDPRECEDINVSGLLNVLEAASSAGVEKLVFASSAAVYGNNPYRQQTEDMLPWPESPYAITKLAGEYYLEMFHSQGRLKTASLRLFNVFGPRQDPASAYAAVIPALIRRAAAGQDLTLYGDGGQSRDFVSVRDVVSALVHVANIGDLNGVINVGYGASITLNQLAERIIHQSGSSSKITRLPARSGDVRHSCASIGRLTASGFLHEGNLERGLAELVAGDSAIHSACGLTQPSSPSLPPRSVSLPRCAGKPS